ncbi:MAG TPA: hypothetical protein VGN00_28910 [Puia sp.]
MMMYLLLRNNKQSGPYSLDDLKTMGLKAYDLVWVEGKSAAWRYPCEINELSAFAPAVEEQPFDRFFKKASPVKAASTSSVVSNDFRANDFSTGDFPGNDFSSNDFSGNNFSGDSPKQVTEPKGEPSRVPGKRIIYVTMPAANSQMNSAPVVNNWSSRPEPVVAAPAPIPAIYKSGSTPIQFEFEDNSAQRQQETAPVVEFTPRPARRRSNPVLKPLIIGLALLAAGIFIGLSINKETLSFVPKTGSGSKSPDNGQVNHTIAQQLPVAAKNDPVPAATKDPHDTVATIIGQASKSDPMVSQQTADRVAASGSGIDRGTNDRNADRGVNNRAGKTPAQKAKSTNGNARPSVVAASTSPAQAKDSALGALSVVHQEAVRRTDGEEKPDAGADKAAAVKANIASQVSVGANGYTVGTFGGINDLQVTVSNRSVYPLDLVVVEVQYIQANRKIYKTENLYFRGIGAGSALMLEAPKSSRGIKVAYKITMINSKDLGLSYSGL